MTRRLPLRRQCPGCGRRPGPVALACPDCCRNVPEPLQRALYAAYTPRSPQDSRPLTTRTWLGSMRAIVNLLETRRYQLDLFDEGAGRRIVNRASLPLGAPPGQERPRPRHSPRPTTAGRQAGA